MRIVQKVQVNAILPVLHSNTHTQPPMKIFVSYIEIGQLLKYIHIDVYMYDMYKNIHKNLELKVEVKLCNDCSFGRIYRL